MEAMQNGETSPRSMEVMHVVKRSGGREEISFDKITKRIRSLSSELKVDPTRVSQKVIENVKDGITTKELDEVSASVAAHMALEHPDYTDLAGRIAVSNHQKNTLPSFYKTMKILYEATNLSDQPSPIISKELWDTTKKHRREIEEAIDYERDYLYDYFGFQTLTRAYLLKYKGKILERIQHMWMRVALGIHGTDLQAAFESYELMSKKFFTHATPTLYNAGTPKPQLSSCFLLECEDSIEGIFKAVTQCANISKWAGGIGMHIHDIRCKGSPIYGTNGVSNGLIPLARTLNAVSRYIDQCHAPDSIVWTSRGFSEISQLTYTDQLLGGDGKYHDIVKILEHDYDGDLIEMTMSSGHSSKCTPGQQYLVSRTYKASEFPSEDKAIYLEANELLEGDYIVTKNPTFVRDIQEWGTDDCYVLGLLMRSNTTSNRFHVVGNTEETLFLSSYLDERTIPYDKGEDGIWWSSHRMFPYTTNTIRTGKSGRVILPDGALHLPAAKARRLLDGMGPNTNYHNLDNVEYLEAITTPISYSKVATIQAHKKAMTKVYDVVLKDIDSYMTIIGLAHHGIADVSS